MDDQKIRMELDWVSSATKGADGARALRKNIAEVKTGLKEVTSATYELAGATQSAGGYELVPSALDHVAAAAPPAVAGLKAVTAAQTAAAASAKTMAAANEQAAAAARISQQRITGLSFALNDFFGAGGGLGQKINSVANNLPMLLAGFGNVGIVASALVPILAAVVTNWDLIAKSLGLAGKQIDLTKTAIELLSERVETLSKKEIKLTVDARELDAAKIKLSQLQKDQAEWDARLERKTADEKEAGGGVKKAIDEGGAGRVFAVVQAAIQKRLIADAKPTTDDDIEKQATAYIERTRGMQSAGSVEQRQNRAAKIKELQEKRRAVLNGIADKSRTDAAGLIREAEAGKAGAAEELAGGLEAADTPDAEKLKGIAGKIREGTPAAARKRRNERAGNANFWDEQDADMAAMKLPIADRKRDKEFGKWVDENDQQIELDLAAERNKKLAAGKKERLDSGSDRAKRTAKAVGQFNETDLDEQAAAFAGQMRSGEIGGKLNSRGQMVPMNQAMQEKLMARELRKQIGFVPDKASKADVVEAMSKKAFGEADDTKAQASLAVGKKATNATERAVQAQQIALATSQALLARLEVAEAKMAGMSVEQLRTLARARADQNVLPMNGR